MKFPEISGRVMADKLANIESTGASVVASLDMSCLTHLSGGAKRKGGPIPRFAHLAELIAEAVEGGIA